MKTLDKSSAVGLFGLFLGLLTTASLLASPFAIQDVMAAKVYFDSHENTCVDNADGSTTINGMEHLGVGYGSCRTQGFK